MVRDLLNIRSLSFRSEQRCLKKWDENQVFAKSMTERDGCPCSCFSRTALG
jgi:hypothetical protein